jgi:hypothetical protein
VAVTPPAAAAAGLAAAAQAIRTEGFMLDSVYTAKAPAQEAAS